MLRCVSLPLGVLRLGALAGHDIGGVARNARSAVGAAGFGNAAHGRPFYLVGGSWRSLAQLDMALSDHPLPIVHQYAMAVDRPAALAATLARLDKQGARELGLSTSRLATLPEANLLLAALAELLRPSCLIVSGFGIREGLLYAALDPPERARDPLVEAAREAGAGLGRFPQHGELLDAWIAPLFDDDPSCARLRLAACLLSDIAWAAHSRFPRRPRRRYGAARQLGGDRRVRPGDAGPGVVHRFRRRQRSCLIRPSRRYARRRQIQRATRWGLAIPARPEAQRRRRRRAGTQQGWSGAAMCCG